jgi:hypothetical protein
VINRWSVAFHPARARHSGLKIAAELLEIHYRAQSLQAVALCRQLSK